MTNNQNGQTDIVEENVVVEQMCCLGTAQQVYYIFG